MLIKHSILLLSAHIVTRITQWRVLQEMKVFFGGFGWAIPAEKKSHYYQVNDTTIQYYIIIIKNVHTLLRFKHSCFVLALNTVTSLYTLRRIFMWSELLFIHSLWTISYQKLRVCLRTVFYQSCWVDGFHVHLMVQPLRNVQKIQMNLLTAIVK